jgi:hypothetical protein
VEFQREREVRPASSAQGAAGKALGILNLSGGQGVVGSNPATPTIFPKKNNTLRDHLDKGSQGLWKLGSILGPKPPGWVQALGCPPIGDRGPRIEPGRFFLGASPPRDVRLFGSDGPGVDLDGRRGSYAAGGRPGAE